ncbi:hypothetical protein RF55_21745 [Lasius niger]|uniref:DUF4806 domain-containing protein n=1 Tax=Lasius niger TaxID=67767 RepID=A0A0J7JX94_LASNI|nr:hypothetical protein RF55_21745 [Lasius niger]
MAENNIINNIIDTEPTKNVEINQSDNIPISVQIPQNLQDSETAVEFINATIINKDNGISTLSLNNSPKLLDVVEIEEKLDTINSNLENLNNHIHREISALHVKFDKLIDLLIKNQSNIIEKSENDPLKNENLERDIQQIKPLAIESDINNLEKKLCNEEFKLAFIKVMSEIGGTTGQKDGNKISYLLMDRLFERQLLTQCSWTGSTKKKEEKNNKIAFFKYNQIIEAIYKIIHLADLRYTIDDNIAF